LRIISQVVFELESGDGVAGTNEIRRRARRCSTSMSGMIRASPRMGLISHERHIAVRGSPARSTRRAQNHSPASRIEAYLTTALG